MILKFKKIKKRDVLSATLGCVLGIVLGFLLRGIWVSPKSYEPSAKQRPAVETIVGSLAPDCVVLFKNGTPQTPGDFSRGLEKGLRLGETDRGNDICVSDLVQLKRMYPINMAWLGWVERSAIQIRATKGARASTRWSDSWQRALMLGDTGFFGIYLLSFPAFQVQADMACIEKATGDEVLDCLDQQPELSSAILDNYGKWGYMVPQIRRFIRKIRRRAASAQSGE